MPNRNKGRKGGAKADSCLMPFRYAFAGALVSGVTSFNLTPAAFPRVAAEADVWAHFRIRKFAFRLLPTSPITVAQAGGYVGGIQDTIPGTFAQVAELLPSTIKGVGQTTPTPWVNVPRVDLAGPLPWYKTVAGSADPTEESPGTWIGVGTGTELMVVEFKGLFEFKTSVAAGNTPMALRLRELVRKERIDHVRALEREVLLKILSVPSGGSSSSQP